jgi:hypothetical protein
VPWLREISEPPIAMIDRPPLAPVLVDSRGRAIATVDAGRARRAELDRKWRAVLGALEIERTGPPEAEILKEDRVEGVVRQRVRYLVERAIETEAYVLRPRGRAGRLPGAIVFHTTTPESIRQPAGLADVRRNVRLIELRPAARTRARSGRSTSRVSGRG